MGRWMGGCLKFTHIDRVVVNCKQNYCNDCQIKCKTQTVICLFSVAVAVVVVVTQKIRYLCGCRFVEEDLDLILFIVTQSLPFASCDCCCCCLFISACVTLKIIYKLFSTIYKLLPQTI